MQNFGRNLDFQPQQIHRPRSEEELLQILDDSAGRRIRPVGNLHSWSRLPETDDVLLDLGGLRTVTVIENAGKWSAEVGAGCPLKEVVAALNQKGLTLPSLGLISEQTVAGAISTGTHGSGKSSLSHYVTAVRIAGYDADTGRATIREVSEGRALQAARCGLGCLGVIVSVTFECRPQYRIEEWIERKDAVEEALACEQETPLQQFFLIPWAWTFFVQRRRETESPRSRSAWFYRGYWFLGLDVLFHLCVLLTARWTHSWRTVRWFFRSVLPRVIPIRWHVVDRSDRQLIMEHELFRHIETEMFVPGDRLPEALEFVRGLLCGLDDPDYSVAEQTLADLQRVGLAERFAAARGRYTHHYPICVRRVLPDDTLISMAADAEAPVYAVSLICYARPSDRDGFFAMAEIAAGAMSRLFGARPHWGKYCPLSAAELRRLYPGLEEFGALRKAWDADGRFLNGWLTEVLDGSAGDDSVAERHAAEPAAR